MNRYSDFLRPGDLIRIGQEGDPCSTYRSADAAPGARVENIEREVDGTVRFRAVMEGSGATVNLDNRNVASDRIWEIHPSQIEEFRKRVEMDRTHRGANDGSDAEDDGEVVSQRENEDEDEQVDRHDHGAVEDLFHDDAIEQRVKDMEFRGTEIEKTMGGAIRELAEDMLRMYHGESPTFSIKFADKYDLALHTDVSYKGSSQAAKADERHEFTVTGEDAGDLKSRSSRRYINDNVTPLASSYGDDVRAVAVHPDS